MNSLPKTVTRQRRDCGDWTRTQVDLQLFGVKTAADGTRWRRVSPRLLDACVQSWNETHAVICRSQRSVALSPRLRIIHTTDADTQTDRQIEAAAGAESSGRVTTIVT